MQSESHHQTVFMRQTTLFAQEASAERWEENYLLNSSVCARWSQQNAQRPQRPPYAVLFCFSSFDSLFPGCVYPALPLITQWTHPSITVFEQATEIHWPLQNPGQGPPEEKERLEHKKKGTQQPPQQRLKKKNPRHMSALALGIWPNY